MRILPVVTVLLLCCCSSVAFADAFDDVFADYQRDGRIDACQHTDAELRDARRQIPNDIEQYAPDFPNALDEARERRARGDCGDDTRDQTDTTPATTPAPGADNGTDAGATPPTTATTPAAPTTPGAAPAPPGTTNAADAAADGAIAQAAERDAETGGDAPAPLLVLAIVGGAIALGLLLWGLIRWLAYEPRWLVASRHATAEAGWRTSGAWADFSDWLRRGRTRRA